MDEQLEKQNINKYLLKRSIQNHNIYISKTTIKKKIANDFYSTLCKILLISPRTAITLSELACLFI